MVTKEARDRAVAQLQAELQANAPAIAEVLLDTPTTPRGGFDGVLVTFGEGADDDTLNSVLAAYPLVEVTLADGTKFDALDGAYGWEDGVCIFKYWLYDEETGRRVGGGVDDIHTVPTEQIVAVHIY